MGSAELGFWQPGQDRKDQHNLRGGPLIEMASWLTNTHRRGYPREASRRFRATHCGRRIISLLSLEEATEGPGQLPFLERRADWDRALLYRVLSPGSRPGWVPSVGRPCSCHDCRPSMDRMEPRLDFYRAVLSDSCIGLASYSKRS